MASNGIDTGTGGFPVGESQELNTYDVGSAEKPGGRWSSGQINVDKRVKDLSPGTLKTLAHYMSESTLGKNSTAIPRPNKYPVTHSASDSPTLLKLTTVDGRPTPPIDVPPAYSFMGKNAVSGFLTTYLSSRTTDEKFLKSELKLGEVIDGSMLLSDFVTKGPLNLPPPRGTITQSAVKNGSPLKSYLESVLSKNDPSKGFRGPDESALPGYVALREESQVPKSTAVTDLRAAANFLDESTHSGALGDINKPANAFPVVSENKSPISLKLTTPRGNTPPLKQFSPGEGSQPFYVESSKLLSFGKSYDTNVRKGREEASAEGPAIDGNRLLLTGVSVQNGLPTPPPRGTVNYVRSLVGPLKSYTKNILGFDPSNRNFEKYAEDFSTGVVRQPGNRTNSLPQPDLVTDTKKSVDYLKDVVSKNEYRPTDDSNTQQISLTSPDGYSPAIKYITVADGKFFTETKDIPGGRSGYSTGLALTRGREADPTPAKPSGNTLLINSVTRQSVIADPPAKGEVNVVSALKAPVKNYVDKFLTTTLYTDTPDGLPINLEMPVRSNIVSWDTKELSISDRATLGEYLHEEVAKNTYVSPVNYPINPQVPDVSIRDTNSQASRPSGGGITPPSDASVFIRNSQFVGRSLLAGDDVNGLKIEKPIEGHTLLLDATKKGAQNLQDQPINPSVVDGKFSAGLKFDAELDDESIAGKYSKSLVNNRFNNDNKWFDYAVDSETARDNLKSKSMTFAKKYSMGTSEVRRTLSLGKLRQVSFALANRSTGEINDGDPSGLSQEALNILPGLAQLGAIGRSDIDGLGLKTVTLTPTDAIETITNDYEGAEINIDKTSWGSLNNPLDTFSGLSALGMQLLALSLVVAISIIMTVLNFIFALLPGTEGSMITIDSEGRKPFGAHEADKSAGDYNSIAGIIGNGGFNFWRIVGVAPTKNDLARCIPIGMLSFFGVDVKGNEEFYEIFTNILKLGQRAAASAGYYTVICRSFNRSFLSISAAFNNLVGSFSIERLLGILEVFRDSKLFKSISNFGQAGDKLIISFEKSKNLPIIDAVESNRVGARRHVTAIDMLPNETSGMKGRLTSFKTLPDNETFSPLGLAWSTHRARDMFLMPASVFGMTMSKNSAMPTPGYTPAALRGEVWKKPESQESRFSPKQREQFENALESEYMPFYIQDVRTNEFVSFHAFLASLDDSYTAAYDSVEAMGRVEPVKTYKGTQRKIGFSFYIVATSPADFDMMWLKINKLTTLVYPQYTRGRKVTTEGGTVVTAPFSQMIQASPLVRLRIGDLIASNYTKFNLARLFGLGDSETKIGTGAVASNLEKLSSLDYAAFAKKILESQKGGDSLTFYPTRPLEEVAPAPPSPAGFLKALGSLFVGNDATFEARTLPTGLALQVVAPANLNERRVTVKVVLDTDSSVEASADDKADLLEKHFYMHPADLIPTEKAIGKIKNKIAEAAAKGASDYYNEFLSFMADNPNSPEQGNAIARSFNTTGGRGLPGFIDSLSFDWYDKATWEIGHSAPTMGSVPDPVRGRRAPKMCKVTVGFTPIHDITPGLDHMGFNRAPIYRVGPAYSGQGHIVE